MSESVFEIVDRHISADTVRQTPMDLLDIRSPTGQEASVAHYLIDRMRKAAIDADHQPVEPGRPNAVGCLRGAGDGINLLFTGHMDSFYSGDEAARPGSACAIV